MGLHSNGVEVSINGTTLKWMVYFMENPKITWMINGGTPHFRKPPEKGCS